jgi:hypothetical protein
MAWIKLLGRQVLQFCLSWIESRPVHSWLSEGFQSHPLHRFLLVLEGKFSALVSVSRSDDDNVMRKVGFA